MKDAFAIVYVIDDRLLLWNGKFKVLVATKNISLEIVWKFEITSAVAGKKNYSGENFKT